MIRTFIALPIPDPMCSILNKLSQSVRQGRLVPPVNYHVTLAFLDDQPTDFLADLDTYLSDICFPQIGLEVKGVNVFGGNKPRLLVADVVKTEILQALHQAVNKACRAAGLSLSSRKYRPHITLSRLPSRLQSDERDALMQFVSQHAGFQIKPVMVDRFAVYRSELYPQGAVYTPMCEYALVN